MGGAEPVDLKSLAQRVDRLAGGCGVEILGAPVPENRRDVYVPPVAKAMSELELTNEVDLDRGVLKMIAWLKAGEA